MNVPCGKCPACMTRKTNAWAFRLQVELKSCSAADFITLTIADENLVYNGNAEPLLVKRDLQLFFKKLRKLQSKTPDWSHVPIKYFAVGEYGTHTHRPHYHLILFNAHLPLIQAAWDKGQVNYGACNAASIAYTLKYMSKPANPAMATRTSEFRLMSKGLGEAYITPAIKAWHNADPYNRLYLNAQDGKKIALPRYYKDRLYDPVTRAQTAFHHAEKMEETICEKLNNQTLTEKHNAVQSLVAKFRKQQSSSLKNRNKL